MKTHIKLTAETYSKVWQHLLPPKESREYLAFLLASVNRTDGQTVLNVEDIKLISDDDFIIQRSDFIELSDEARVSVIKKAHTSGYSLIELHSHPFPGQWAATFSIADMNGFAETVPNMLWRLPDRPYTAIVVAPNGFDALIWTSVKKGPEAISGLMVNDKILKPTNYTLGGTNDQRRTSTFF